MVASITFPQGERLKVLHMHRSFERQQQEKSRAFLQSIGISLTPGEKDMFFGARGLLAAQATDMTIRDSFRFATLTGSFPVDINHYSLSPAATLPEGVESIIFATWTEHFDRQHRYNISGSILAVHTDGTISRAEYTEGRNGVMTFTHALEPQPGRFNPRSFIETLIHKPGVHGSLTESSFVVFRKASQEVTAPSQPLLRLVK